MNSTAKRLLAAGAIVTSMAIVSACTQTVSGTAMPADDEGPKTVSESYGLDLPAGDQQKLDAAARLRQVDPCGFFDRDALAKHGVVAVVGPRRNLSTCHLGILLSNRKQYHSYLTVDLAGRPPSHGEETTEIAGETIALDKIRNNKFGDCAFKVPLRFSTDDADSPDQDIVEVSALPYALVQSSGFTPDSLGCQLAEGVVTNMVNAFREKRIPSREQAELKVPLSDRSPCELITNLPSGYRTTQLSAEAAPYECTFKVATKDAGTRDGTARISIEFLADTSESAMKVYPSDSYPQELTEINGKKVLITRNDSSVGSPSCFIRFPVGPVLDGHISGTPATDSAREHARVQIMVKIFTPCAVAEKVTPPAMALFGAN